ncbi:MAG: nuclear transport factor 2 family protein [Alphaproteobacteria bacterium]|nr:nuclear transport factor 2 family protein [Alphaproteobacteria bacterium]
MNRPRDVVERYFRCMQAGPGAAEDLFALFADDAVYTEPFTGTSRTHQGRAAIERTLRDSWQQTPPDLVLTVDRVDVDGDTVTSLWTCTSPVFPGPMRGRDVCVVRDGRIASLEVCFLPS